MKRDNTYLIGNQFAKGQPPNSMAFKKGRIPWNKGIRGTHFSPATEFKRGQKGINWLPVGSIKTRTEWHNSLPSERRWIKIAEPNKWSLLAIHIWTKRKGSIPKGMLIHHKDFDYLNDDFKNLQMLTRSEHINIHRAMLEAFRKDIIPDSCKPLVYGWAGCVGGSSIGRPKRRCRGLGGGVGGVKRSLRRISG